MVQVALGWVFETLITGSLAVLAFFLSVKQYQLEKRQEAPKKLHLYFHRANIVTSVVIVGWVLDLHGLYGIYPLTSYYFFGAFCGNWLWTQGIFYFYSTERALSHTERKNVSPWWKIVFVVLVLLAWGLAFSTASIEHVQDVHRYWWIYSFYMAAACAVLQVIGFHMLRTLRAELILLHKNLGSLNKEYLWKVQKLWIGNTILLLLAIVGFLVTGYQHYLDRDDVLTSVDVVNPNVWDFSRPLFFVLISLALLYYFIWITWLPMCHPRPKTVEFGEYGSFPDQDGQLSHNQRPTISSGQPIQLDSPPHPISDADIRTEPVPLSEAGHNESSKNLDLPPPTPLDSQIILAED